jgi:ribosomal protein S18 acetylase RimI-like enzyme
VTTLRIRPFAAADTEAVVALWREAGLTRPWNDPYRDIERKLTVQPELFLVATSEERVRGFYAALGYEDFDTRATGKRLIADEPAAPVD